MPDLVPQPVSTLPSWTTVAELEARARDLLDRELYDFIAGGAGDERTVAANRAGFARLRLRPRVLRRVTPVDTASQLLGTRLGAPVLVAPMGFRDMIHPWGPLGVATAAAEAGVGFIVSSHSLEVIDSVRMSGNETLWCQTSALADRDWTRRLVDRAEAGGYGALCVTVDMPAVPSRRRDLRNGFDGSKYMTAVDPTPVPPMDFLASAYPGVPYLAPVTWDDLAWLRSVTRLPVTVKGIMTAEDALEAVACGIDGIVVSNHGGRQLDDVPGSIEVLGEIVDAVEGRAAVLLDGGVQTGGDAAIALCLGADAVTIGRPVLWALAAGGPEGVRSFLGAFVQDLARTMVLLGATSLDELRPAMVMSDGLSRRHGGGDGPSAPSV